MKALKALVVLMGALILAGLGLIAFTVANRAGAPRDDAGASAPAPRESTAPAFGEVSTAIPPGYALVDMTAEGDRLMLRIEGDGKAPRVLVLDLRTGRTLGTVVLDNAAARPR